MSYRKHCVVYLSAALILLCCMFFQTSLAIAQTPEPDVPTWPLVDEVTDQLGAKAATDPELQALAQRIAGKYEMEFGAEYTVAHVFDLDNNITVEDIVDPYDTLFEQAGWVFDKAAAETTGEPPIGIWSDGYNIFVIHYQPAGEEFRSPVLVTVRMLAIEDFEGIEIVEADTDPTLAAIADNVAAKIREGTGAETEVKIMTFPAEVDVEDILAFYQEGMAQAGWQLNETLTQDNQQFSSMGWVDGNSMIVCFVISASKQTDNRNLLLWIGAALPDTASETTEVTPTPAR